MALYDYIYVDLEKVISLYSQLTGGVVELRETNREKTQTADNKRNYDFKVFKHDAGGTAQDKTGVKEVIKPHHSLLTELEAELARNGYLIDLTDPINLHSLRDAEFRNQLKSTFCVKIGGRAVVEDWLSDEPLVYRIKAPVAAAKPDLQQIQKDDPPTKT